MNCEHCGTPIADEENVVLLSWTDDLYAHTDCRDAA